MVVKFIAYIVGVPSLGSVAFVSIVGLWYAWIFTSDWGTWAAVSAGLVFIAAFSAGLPIAWAHTRGRNNVVAHPALGLWIACVTMNFFTMSQFARYVPEAAAPAFIKAPDLSAAEIEKLDYRIESIRDILDDFDEEVAAGGRRRQHALSTENGRGHADLQAELRSLEAKRYGLSVTKGAPARPGSASGLDMAGIALIMIAGSAVGCLISAGSVVAVMTSNPREMRGEAEGAMPSDPAGGVLPRVHAARASTASICGLVNAYRGPSRRARSSRPLPSLTMRLSARQTTSAPASIKGPFTRG